LSPHNVQAAAQASRQLQPLVGQHPIGSIGALLFNDPICDLAYNLLLYTVETMISHSFAGISPVLSSFNRE
jgi:hypothetical protein